MATDGAEDPGPYGRERCLAVTLAAERMLREVSAVSGDVLDGLADRPGPGHKARARESFRAILSHVGELRRTVASTRPMRIVGSGTGDDASPGEGARGPTP